MSQIGKFQIGNENPHGGPSVYLGIKLHRYETLGSFNYKYFVSLSVRQNLQQEHNQAMKNFVWANNILKVFLLRSWLCVFLQERNIRKRNKFFCC